MKIFLKKLLRDYLMYIHRINLLPLKKFLGSIILLSGLYLSTYVYQNQFIYIVLVASMSFGGFALILSDKTLSKKVVLGIGVAARLIFWGSFPHLSDDIYRFVWDGRLIGHGVNPYGLLPREVLGLGIPGLGERLISEMNSPGYYTIYPPVSQLVFYISTIFGGTVEQSATYIQVLFVIVEIGTFVGISKLLNHSVKSKKNTLAVSLALYFLNPLVILEGVGNLHFEILMVGALVWAMYYLFVKNNVFFGALFFGLSIGVKLLPLMFLPYFLWRLGRERIRFFGVISIVLLIIFSPVLMGIQFLNLWSSIDLYFQKFEFNAGIYYLLRYAGYLLSGYNLIHYFGPLLGLITVVGILWLSGREKVYDLASFSGYALYSFLLYLFLATTVHPWYLILPIFLSAFSTNKLAVLWSFLVFLSYSRYSLSMDAHLWLVALEYVLIGGLAVFWYLPESRMKSV